MGLWNNSKILCPKNYNLLKSRPLTASTKLKDGDDRDYQFMQKTKIPMMHFQPSLPRLPIPDLNKTCDRYLNSLKPVLDAVNFEKSTKIVRDFQLVDGPKLQTLLKDHDKRNKHTSYISEPWFDMYLRDRQPLPLNYNPLMMFNHDKRPEYNTQLIRASNLIVSALRFYKSLRNGILEPEIFHLNPKKSDTEQFRNILRRTPSMVATYVAYAFKAFPLDMSQYGGLFAGTRIPEAEKDRIQRHPDSRHLVVMRNGHFYSVNVIEENGDISSPQQILERIKFVLADNRSANRSPNSIGIFTTESRDRWSHIRKHLESVGDNKKSLDLIDSGLFCLCLDDDVKFDPSNPVPAVKEFLASDGHNRWFDKSLSLIVTRDGTAGVNFEHSWGDGVAVLRFFQDVYKETTTRPFINPGDENQSGSSGNVDSFVKLLPIMFDATLENNLNESIEKHDRVLKSLNLNYFQNNSLGRKFCKKYGLSPDSFMQLGFQLGYYKQNGHFVSTYESCSTAAFRHGRTETMRPCTIATREFCEGVMNKQKTNEELREMIDNCSKIHSTLTKDAAMGQGFDRHLFGMRHIAAKNNIENVALFADEAYSKINYNVLSTSTLSSPAVLAGGFGPVVPDGYGIGYNIQNDYMGTIVTSYSPHRNGAEFVKCLADGYEDIRKIVEKFPPKSK